MKYLPLASLLLSNLAWSGQVHYEPNIWFFLGEPGVPYTFEEDCHTTLVLSPAPVCIEYSKTGYVWADLHQSPAVVPVPPAGLMFLSGMVLITISRIKRKAGPASGI